jgi:hypothetical protein
VALTPTTSGDFLMPQVGAIVADAAGNSTVSVTPLQPHTTYFANVTGEVVSGRCVLSVVGNLGSFTTQ